MAIFHLPVILLVASCIRTVASTASDATAKVYDFDKLASLLKRLDVLEGDAPETLLGFYDPALSSFSVQGGDSPKNRVCITNTCYALLTMTLSPKVYESIVSYDDDDDDNDDDDANTIEDTDTSSSRSQDEESGEDKKIPIRKVMKKLLASKWRNDDLFQVPLLIYTILFVDFDRALLKSAAVDEDLALKIRELLSVTIEARPHRRSGLRQENSDYISYQACKVIALLHGERPTQVPNRPAFPQRYFPPQRKNSDDNQEDDLDSVAVSMGGLPLNALPEEAESEVFWALLRCAELSSNELCRQLAYRTAGDSNSFDVIRLAYSLLTYIRSTESLSSFAGKEMVPGEGPAPETRVAPLNRRLVASALAAFFEEQNKDGLWDKGQPIYKSFRKWKGRSMGNAFVFPVNTLGSLLCNLHAEDFRPHLAALEKTLEWVESHQSVEMMTTSCDPETGKCHGKPLRGWSSPHHEPDAGPQAWPTAQVLKCVSWMRITIRRLMHKDVLEEFNGIPFSNDGVQTASWDQLLDSDLGEPDMEDRRTIKSVLEERIVEPFASSIDNPSYGAAYSAILFGPPGTAKTTLCESLAKRMGYDFLVIDTSVFLADGLTNVSARIRYVFKRLMALKRCIILFDEIEEFCLDRENPGLSMESRMLTTAMLTAINDLRRHKQSIFFVATNRLKAFDSAITRPGRFDMQLFVGTPNLHSRVTQFQHKLAGNPADEKEKAKATEAYRAFLESVWSQDAMFMNYLEGMQFASACSKVVASKARLTKTAMSAILRQQAAVMTVRGPARDEYLASMELSRI